jgi:hypothetical protein
MLVIGSVAFLVTVFFTSMLGHISASEAAKSYEYKLVIFKVKTSQTEPILNKMGAEGWRLIQFDGGYAVFEK